MAKGGRLSYSRQLVDQICARLCIGETLAEICANPPWPSAKAVYSWVNCDAYAREQIALAREIGEDSIASATRKIARGVKKIEDFEPGTSEQRDKLVVDTDLRLLGFWNPKKYSERKQVDMNINLDTASLFDKMELARQQASHAVNQLPAVIIDSEVTIVDDDPLW